MTTTDRLDTLRGAVDYFAGRFVAVASELAAARVQLAAVNELVEHARKISPSPSMTLYVADVQRALGHDVARPHKLGQETTP